MVDLFNKIGIFFKSIFNFFIGNYKIILIILTTICMIYVLINFLEIFKSYRKITNITSAQCESENEYYSNKGDSSKLDRIVKSINPNLEDLSGKGGLDEQF